MCHRDRAETRFLIRLSTLSSCSSLGSNIDGKSSILLSFPGDLWGERRLSQYSLQAGGRTNRPWQALGSSLLHSGCPRESEVCTQQGTLVGHVAAAPSSPLRQKGLSGGTSSSEATTCHCSSLSQLCHPLVTSSELFGIKVANLVSLNSDSSFSRTRHWSCFCSNAFSQEKLMPPSTSCQLQLSTQS